MNQRTSMTYPIFGLHIPEWLDQFLSKESVAFSTVEERMRFVIALSRASVHNGGGPFAAAVFSIEDRSLLAAGVNLVLSGRCSVLHAEIVAIIAGQQRIGSHDLSSLDSTRYELITSTEPCAMCLGAITWSGIQRLVCGARGSDAEETGFDEGEKPPRWAEALEQRGISVRPDVCREHAVAVLKEYAASGGIIYNPLRGHERR